MIIRIVLFLCCFSFSAFADYSDTNLAVTLFPDSFKPVRFTSDNKVIGLRKISSDGSSVIDVVTYEPGSKSYNTISHTPLITLDSFGVGDYSFNEKGEAILSVSKYSPNEFSLTEGLYYQAKNGEYEKLHITVKDDLSLTYDNLHITNGGLASVRAYRDNLSDFDHPTYVFLKNGVETGRWKMSVDNYSSATIVADGRLLVTSKNQAVIVGTDGKSETVPEKAFPVGYEFIAALDNNRVVIRDSQKSGLLFSTDLVHVPDAFASEIAKDTEISSFNTVVTSKGDIGINGAYTQQVHFSKGNHPVADAGCMLRNSKRLFVISVQQLSHAGMVLAQIGHLDNYSYKTGLISVKDLSKQIPNYCSTITHVSFNPTCAKDIERGRGSGAYTALPADDAFHADKSISQACKVSVSVKDAQHRPVKNAAVRLVDKGVWRPDADGGGYFDPAKFIQEAKTDSAGHAVVSGKMFQNNHDFELIAPYKQTKLRSSSLYFFGVQK